MMRNGDCEGHIFYPILTQIMDSFSCSLLNITAFYVLKKLKEVPEYAEMQYMMLSL